MLVRPGRPDDIPQLTAIYNHYVRESFSTLDEQEVTVDAALVWAGRYRLTGPWRLFIADEGGRVLGMSTSSPYREHVAFAGTVETSVYLDPELRGRGVGTGLYRALFDALAGEGLHRAVAGIALPNPASVALHERVGFRKVGVFDGYAAKRGRFVSSLWMEKALDGAF